MKKLQTLAFSIGTNTRKIADRIDSRYVLTCFIQYRFRILSCFQVFVLFQVLQVSVEHPRITRIHGRGLYRVLPCYQYSGWLRTNTTKYNLLISDMHRRK